MIRLQVDAKDYGARRLFEAFDIRVAPGELLCLLGPSGCGKTTLLNIIAGLDTDYAGTLTGPRAGPSVDGPAVGYMFQQPRLLPWRTLRQNLQLVVDPEHYHRIAPLLAQMGLGEYIDSYPNRLSLGMARRAALARCLIIDPGLILMDEPFVSLDPPTAAEMRQRIQALRRRRHDRSILLVTHDLREAVQLADRILVLGGSPTRVLHQWQGDRPPEQRSRRYIEQEERKLLHRYPRTEAARPSAALEQCQPDATEYQRAGNQQAPA
ncbi:ABC transporter ATP-binding protein [Motiliproteus sp. SC1-56]|uniref:ABC transporter ATP-binding protein n=1 Tax=Motiliproteus sp. SC1-56 TaxID=2799565 RepID=UPI001A8E869D|nr:ATP-binding cassette domain-containing protein [Motiliproteus sp. SC1-56]